MLPLRVRSDLQELGSCESGREISGFLHNRHLRTYVILTPSHPLLTLFPFTVGSFGLAMASVLGSKDFPVTMLMRKQEAVDYFNTHHESDSYIKGVKLPP